MHDNLGKRMKEQYEHRTRYFLPRRTYTIIRVDGKAFHTFTKGFDKPFDTDLMEVMDETALALCQDIQGAQFAYVQSDEISVLLTDFKKPTSCAWFDGNIQKIASISASIATANFNNGMYLNENKLLNMDQKAFFDSRVYTIPDPIEVENYFIWRQQDASRNSVQMAARSVYSHKECENKNVSELQDMLHKKGINWNDYSYRKKRGGLIAKREIDIREDKTVWSWANFETPIFTQEREVLRGLIPRIGEESDEKKL